MYGRKIILLFAGVFLCILGISLIWYGSTIPADIVLRSRYNYLNVMGEVNIFTWVGLVMLPLGIGCLLFWFLTRSKKLRLNMQTTQE